MKPTNILKIHTAPKTGVFAKDSGPEKLLLSTHFNKDLPITNLKIRFSVPIIVPSLDSDDIRKAVEEYVKGLTNITECGYQYSDMWDEGKPNTEVLIHLQMLG